MTPHADDTALAEATAALERDFDRVDTCLRTAQQRALPADTRAKAVREARLLLTALRVSFFKAADDMNVSVR